jgi:hypothetical protein
MKIKLAAIAAQQGGVIFRSQALDAGMSDDEIRQLIDAKVWLAVRRGAYADRKVWAELDAESKHRALVRAAVHRMTGMVVVSHSSALVLHALPTWRHDLSNIHVTRAKTFKSEAGVQHHRGQLTDDDVVTVEDLRVTKPARAIIETAMIGAFEACVASADAAIRAELTSREEMLALVNTMRDWPGARNAGRVVASSDGRSESVGESFARMVMDAGGLPEPELQAEFSDADGFIGRVDFYFREHHTIVEFDGRVKYTPELAPGGDPAAALWQEKRREDRLRALGYEVVRITWADLHDPVKLAAKIRQAFDRAERRFGRHAA